MLRTLGICGVATLLTAAIVVSTDEYGSTAAMRIARLCAMEPALAGLGCFAALAQSERRGELRALQALGVSPWRLCLGPCAAGWALGLLAIAVLLSPLADAASLFPVVAPASFRPLGPELVDPVRGVAVERTGELRFLPPAESLAVLQPGARSACWALAPLALVVPPWSGAPVAVGWRLATGVAALAAVLVLLHAVAAGRLAPFWMSAAVGPLALQTLWGYLKP